jgi:hypothetical protein
VWGLPTLHTMVILREGTTVEADESVFFTSDRVALRARMRVAFGFPHPAAVVKIVRSAD